MADSEATPTKGRKIQVANARPEDSGRGIARMPRGVMAELGLAEGDVVEIAGKRTTASRVVHSYDEDEGLDVLRLDGLQRANTGVGSGDFVTVSKAESRPAQRVVLAPALVPNSITVSGAAHLTSAYSTIPSTDHTLPIGASPAPPSQPRRGNGSAAAYARNACASAPRYSANRSNAPGRST